MEAYLDNAATTRAADEVAKVVTDIMLMAILHQNIQKVLMRKSRLSRLHRL